MSLHQISVEELPVKARKGISKQQMSYIDEFRFFEDEKTGDIQAYYAGELLCVFQYGKWYW